MKAGFSVAIRIISLVFLMVSFAVTAIAETVPGDLDARFANIPKLEYAGAQYRLKRRLNTILLAGTDNGLESQGYALGARNGGQADFLLLVVIDDADRKVTPIQINRDTMTEITVLNVLGQVSGSRVAQICLAHAFGDGREESCELLVSAVSGLLKNTPVDHYYVMDFEGVGPLNDALGGVEVTLEEDFSAYDPEMTPGKTLKLNGEQAAVFLRSRYYVGDQTNVSRMSRQRRYMDAAKDIVMARAHENINYITTLMNAVGEYAVTDMGRGRLLNYMKAIVDYDVMPMRSVEGEALTGESGFMEFICDDDALTQLLVEVFYEPVD